MSFQIRLLFYSLMILPLLVQADAPTMTRVLKEEIHAGNFPFCNGGTCADVKTTGLSDDEWQQVRDLFEPEPENAEQEKERIRQAIGLLERIVGAKTGTATDRGGTFGNSAYPGQLDCNDEATNSTTYMKLMSAEGLLRFHRIEDTKTRGGFLFFGWHSTAAISDKASGKLFAVDSWFFDNGVPPVILPLEAWQNGWQPPSTPAHQAASHD